MYNTITELTVNEANVTELYDRIFVSHRMPARKVEANICIHEHLVIFLAIELDIQLDGRVRLWRTVGVLRYDACRDQLARLKALDDAVGRDGFPHRADPKHNGSS